MTPHNGNTQSYQLHPIGSVQRRESGFYLQLDGAYRPGLRQLNQFSHVIVLWWADQQDDPE